MHEAAVEARGDLLVLLSESLSDLGSDSISRLAGALGEPDVAFAGGRIVFADGTVKHAGYRKSQTHLRDAVRCIGTEPCCAHEASEFRRHHAIGRRDARIAPMQIRHDQLQISG